GMPEITADHPEVQVMVEEAMKSASLVEVTLSPEIFAEVLERAIAELMENNKDRFPGAPEKGGWVVDNYPLSLEHWSALSEKGLLPDIVVCLKDTAKDGVSILHRTYLANRDEINSKILKRLTDEALAKKEEEVRREMQEILMSEEDQSLEDTEEETEKITLPEFTEDDLPDIPEMEIIKRNIELFTADWQTVESEIKQSSLVLVLEIAEQTPESLLNQTVLVMEKPFQYHAWELSDEDLDEEAEDLAAEGEDEDVEEEEN
ncbi:KAD9 kinase, partial [Chloroceryle aenea]|nr:KAD9 kinase [Chloroceryle aenea]